MTAPYNDPKVRLNHIVVCHVPRDIVKILPNTRHLAPLDPTNSLAISWQRNCTSTLFLSQNIGEGQKILCPPCPKVGRKCPPRPLWNSVPAGVIKKLF